MLPSFRYTQPTNLMLPIPTKAYIALGAVLIVLGIAYGFYVVLKNNAQLQVAVEQQNLSIQAQQRQHKIVLGERDKLAGIHKENITKINKLKNTLARHDLGHLANAKPGLIESRINKAIAAVLLDTQAAMQRPGLANE